MLIRIKFDGKSRKLSEKVTTVSDLKAKINELFGIEPSLIQIVYKDCDGEMVDVVDDEDLKNCYNEVNELNQSSLTFIITNKQQTPRSHSRENRSKNSGEESIGQSGPLLPATRGNASIEPSRQELSSTEITFSDKGDTFTSGAQILTQEKRRQEGQDTFELTPASFIEEVLQSVQGECPGLLENPKLLSLVLGSCALDLETIVKRHYKDVIKHQPSILSFNQVSNESWMKGDLANKFESRKEIAEPLTNKIEGNAGNQPPVNYERTSNSRGGNFEFRGQDRYYPQSVRRHHYTSYHQDHHHHYDSYKQQPKDTRKYPAQEGDKGREDPNIAEPLRKLCQKFPQKTKAELRAIIQQNPDKTVVQLESLITQSRKAKSRYY